MNTTLTKKFVDEMKIYQQAQQQYKTDIKKKVKRQVQVVKPDATDEEVDAVMKSEGGRDALYKQSILAGGVNDQIKCVFFPSKFCVMWVCCVFCLRPHMQKLLTLLAQFLEFSNKKERHMPRLLESTRTY
jgi:hypothetical protein